jgi:hypothetical protein
MKLTNRTKVPHEQSLPPVLATLRYELVKRQGTRYAAEEKYQNAKEQQPGPCNAACVWLVEVVPGDHGADVHETAEVEKHVYAWVDFVVAGFGLGEKASVPVQGDSGGKASEEVIRADAAASADNE